ncbi:uncharacterized protein N0V89_004425 [Didymosphaeria variabile]|uniref:Uncharacterized protein n=1 Tax=Didymosphaeria variabile TaxID=1932322 RepID=A0A9W8XQE0_9PLEO|nr:uncharacterized protein N0V89_004425 [Didymosphaeria variabile]KAJ4356392.1 hypothetical protein N0V89_004425 [Didymosphaeria variabile]
MTNVTHNFGYAIVRAGVPTTDDLHILYVFRSLENAHTAITKFANSSEFTQAASRAPSELRELDGSIPKWWKSYSLFDGYFPVGSVYVERVNMED